VKRPRWELKPYRERMAERRRDRQERRFYAALRAVAQAGVSIEEMAAAFRRTDATIRGVR